MSKTLEEIIAAPSLVREQWLSTELAVREVLAFERRFGSKHLMLACHAALPLILTPELLNLIHINFLDEEQIPWIAEADFLLSPLCRPIDEGLFEVEPSIREVLLVELENQFGFERPFGLAKFLQFYLNHKSGYKQRSEITSTQRWIAKAYINPDKVVEELTDLLKLSLSNGDYLLNLDDITESTIIIELLAEPLERTNLFNKYQYLINDLRVLSNLIYGEIDTFKTITNSPTTKNRIDVSISPTLSKVLKNLEEDNLDRAIKRLVDFFNGELISFTSVENDYYLLDPESEMTNEVMVNDDYSLYPTPELIDNEDAEDILCIRIRDDK
jgi:hypothetical protein